jgi:hypothetical protein
VDDEYMDGDDEFAYPWSWRAAVCMVADHAAVVLRTGASLIGSLSTQLAADHNYRINQRDFRNAVARDIETITTEE